jgi:RNA polymerase sigma-70 factor (ECF subfamily)
MPAPVNLDGAAGEVGRVVPAHAKRTSGEPDAALVRRVVAGDAGAFEALMRRHNRRLYRLARATLRDDAEAEDAVQEAYLAAFHHLDRFRGESTLATWLSRLVLNACFGRLRKAQRRERIVAIVSMDDEDGPDARVAVDAGERPDAARYRTELRDLIERKLDALPASFRTVFVLRAVEDLSVQETAQCLGIAEETVRSRHFRARAMLRDALARELDVAERDVFGFDGARCDRLVEAVLSRLHRREGTLTPS